MRFYGAEYNNIELGVMEQSTTILNEAFAEFNIVVLCSIKQNSKFS
jgi:hypothetical protein